MRGGKGSTKESDEAYTGTQTNDQTTTGIGVRTDIKNFTPHLSPLEAEGRRNQPRNPSPKKTKERRAKENVAKANRVRELGALEPYMASTDQDL